MTTRSMSMADVIRSAVDTGMARMRVSMPAEIVSFDPATQTARVKPLLKDSYLDEDDARQSIGLPHIDDVPVQFFGSGGFSITCPVSAGDSCMLVFSDRSLDAWMASGRESDPIDERIHHLGDAVAILGLRSNMDAIENFDTAGIRLGSNDGVGVLVENSTVNLGVEPGETASESGVLGDELATYLNTLKNALDAFSTGLNPGTLVGQSATLKAALQLLSTSSLLSSKVKLR